VKSSKKAYISFLMPVFFMSGIAALDYIGVFDFNIFPDMPIFVKAIVYVVIFLALFSFVFFLFSIKRSSSMRKKTGNPEGVTRHQDGLLAAASAYQRYDLSPSDGNDETSGIDVIYEENGVPYINSDLAKRNNQGTLNRNFIKLVESVTGSPF
jgi:hypothetical protein